MADQKDQRPDPPAEDPTFIPLEKSAIAEKSLPGYNREPESKSESDSSDSSDSGDDDDEDVADRFGKRFMKKKVEELKMKAFYSVIQAFRAETSTLSNKRTLILEKMMKALNISHETHIAFEDNIQKNLLAQQKRVDSSAAPDEKKMQMAAEARPLAISDKEAETWVPTRVDTSGSGWDRFDPESVVGKWVSLRNFEENFEEFFIKEYDAIRGIHRLETADSNAMEVDDFLSWIDFREIPPQDIIWERGEKL